MRLYAPAQAILLAPKRMSVRKDVAMANKSDTDWMISALEGICAGLENSGNKSEGQIEVELKAAAAAAEAIIERSVPQTERNVWRSALHDACESEPVANPPSEGNGTAKQNAPQCANCCTPLTAENTQIAAPCIHGCSAQFCTATCRRRGAREHRKQCTAIERKALLKKIGLTCDEDLF